MTLRLYSREEIFIPMTFSGQILIFRSMVSLWIEINVSHIVLKVTSWECSLCALNRTMTARLLTTESLRVEVGGQEGEKVWPKSHIHTTTQVAKLISWKYAQSKVNNSEIEGINTVKQWVLVSFIRPCDVNSASYKQSKKSRIVWLCFV